MTCARPQLQARRPASEFNEWPLAQRSAQVVEVQPSASWQSKQGPHVGSPSQSASHVLSMSEGTRSVHAAFASLHLFMQVSVASPEQPIARNTSITNTLTAPIIAEERCLGGHDILAEDEQAETRHVVTPSLALSTSGNGNEDGFEIVSPREPSAVPQTDLAEARRRVRW
jgi:hypothetical protein